MRANYFHAVNIICPRRAQGCIQYVSIVPFIKVGVTMFWKLQEGVGEFLLERYN